MIGLLRRLWRDARSAPVLGRLIDGADRLWWMRVIGRSGLMDAEFYRAQRGWRRGGRLRATLDYVWSGFRAGISPNPLFDEHSAGDALPDLGRVPAINAYLLSDRATVAVHPWWDAAAYADAHGVRGGALEHAWSNRGSAVIPVRIGDGAQAVRVTEWRRLALESLATDRAGDAEVAENLVMRMLQGGDAAAAQKIAGALPVAGDSTAVRLVCIEATPSTWLTAALAARLCGRGDRVAAVRLPSSTRLHALARAVAADSAGGAVLVTDTRADLDAEQYRGLLATGAGALVAPVCIEWDGTVAAVGASVVETADGPRVCRVLRDHPSEDLRGFDERIVDVPLLTGRTFAAPAALVRGFAGAPAPRAFETEHLSLQAHRSGVPVRVATGMVVGCFSARNAWPETAGELPDEFAEASGPALPSIELYRIAGFEVEGWNASGPWEARPHLRASGPAQRWAIKTCAPAGPAGQVWGDTHFAQGLASALRRRGHEVVVDAFPAAARPTAYLDDVHVVIRGPFRIAPPQTGVRIEWIISHPDEITRAEIAQFDLVFAVSPGWAQRVSAEWGLDVQPLLEATDADLFFPRGHARGSDVVFVGTARGIPRPSVVAPLDAGIDVKVYGPDWRGFIPAEAIAAASIPNRDLSERYETARVVLNDHWPAMRREGFMAMRPFDAVAAGGRVISESVPLLREVFEGAVVEYESPEQLVELLSGDVDALFPTDAELREISARVREHHSFDARAAVLDAAVGKLTNSAR